LLGSEYEHGLQILIEAKARFTGTYSDWLNLQDSFGDIVTRKFFDFLRAKGLTGYSSTINRNGKLVNYGALLSAGSPFDRAYPVAAQALKACHDRRNNLPGSHPYNKRGGAQNQWLQRHERDALALKVKQALDEIASVVERYK